MGKRKLKPAVPIIIIAAVAVIAAVVCFLIFGNKKPAKTKPAPASSSSEIKPKEDPKSVNPLTGVSGFDATKYDVRPTAVMINNVSIAQPVQCGVKDADIVYETEVEDCTRLMAVYKDITKVNKFGSVRSARYPFVDLALGHDAVYLHHGQDPTYCAPHLNDIDHITVDTGNCGKRIPNGLAWEHTLFGFGESALTTIQKSVSRTNLSKTEPWQTFTKKDDAPVNFAGQVANTVTIPWRYSEEFNYNSATGLYERSCKGTPRVDYDTKEQVAFKNVFVLLTTIVNYPDGEHRQVYLDGGDGYYAVNGTYTQIRWTKGDSKNPIKLTDLSGAPLTVNQGTSWVAIANASTTTPSFQ